MDAPVVVVGLGGVGSHCAHALLRASGASGTIRRLRLIDFDRVSLSSLNRHAVALRRDVGLPKVASCAEHFRAISPTLQVDARDAMFTAEAAEELLLQSATGEVENPRLVVDCIDDVKTKVELLAFCSARGLPVVSALGSGAKDDPTKICVAQGLRDIDNDPLATKLRKACSTQGMDWSHISFIYSSQKVQRALLPLSDEQRSNPEEFGSVANFRLRVIPVLGPQPAAAGMAIASQVLNRLDNLEEYWPQPTPAPRRNLVDKLLDSFKRDELNASGGRSCLVDVTPVEATFMVHEVWLRRSALNPELDAFAATGIRFTLCKWDARKSATANNLILATVKEAEKHRTPEDASPEVRKRVEALLSWATTCLEKPLTLPCNEDEQATKHAEQNENPENEHWLASRRGESPTLDAEEMALVTEQLSRSSSFLGSGQEKVQKSFVVIIGLGAVGSSAAILLARAGVGKLRLVDGAVVRSTADHALAKAADIGRAKVDVCKEAILRVLPHLEIDAVHEDLKNLENLQEIGEINGKNPDVILDCLSSTQYKELLVKYALDRKIRLVSVVTTPRPVPADPSRVVVAPLGEVWACLSAVALRCRLIDPAMFKDIEVVHSQEPGLWARHPRQNRGVEHRLQLGATAAAVAILRVTGGSVSHQVEPCGMTLWKKLRNSLERMEAGGDHALDLHGIGCLADYIWRGRSAISSIFLKHSDMALTRWDVSKPIGFANLVLMTAEEAQRHRSLARSTGSLPLALLEALKGEGEREASNEAVALIRTHKLLQRMQEHLEESFSGSDLSRSKAARECRSKACRLAADNTLPRGESACWGSFAAFAGLVGETKVVELRCLSESTSCKILGKAEFLSPGGCQKDRVARQIIHEAKASGSLSPGGTIVEGTSGSTGISLCLAAASSGYKVHVVMPDDQAEEKAELLRRFGATVQMVRPASISSPEHYVNVARKHAEKLNAESANSAIFANQFENSANFRAHYQTTGPELWSQCFDCTPHKSLDAFVMSAGTGGTLAGVGRFLKEQDSSVKVILADVSGSALYYKVQKGVLYAPEQEERSIRRHRQDTIAEGIGNDRLTANFALGLEEHNGGFQVIDSAVRVSDQEALDMAHHILRHEGLFLGSSAAVNCVAAVKVARMLPKGSTIATILCDAWLEGAHVFESLSWFSDFVSTVA
ncbi:Cysteine synthase 2 (CS 2) (Cysteine synthase-like protein) (CSl) (O-acetylserine (thiol)-lyase 2) (OAS-TL 2) (O-acetylserine sulfhydrylase 2) [Durusdinium trenchii]|uniref:Cysteine synthase 2 (CS 2) (Cysteine synthase-like protein) (CSl) (O-acetylserine (Thiol)-lyase 2) (OAS-TL 2) (O-acetylserine sulfhydrylase 2) n=1 Tax=Durusdinium trenchii TaxID=1381693 RepID=A0ABP0JHF4_9DINO